MFFSGIKLKYDGSNKFSGMYLSFENNTEEKQMNSEAKPEIISRSLFTKARKRLTERVIWKKPIDRTGPLCNKCGEKTFYLGIAPRDGNPSFARAVFYCPICENVMKLH